nr:hypothetical protein CFP56_64293 [Quercus suber]
MAVACSEQAVEETTANQVKSIKYAIGKLSSYAHWTSILENGKGGSGDGDALACDLNLFEGKSKNFLDSKYKRQISPVKRLF